MARKFNGSTQFLLNSSTAAYSTYPYAISLWFNVDIAQSALAYSTGDQGGGGSDFEGLQLLASTNRAYARTWNGSSAGPITTATYSTTTWTNAVAMFVGTADRRIFLDGGGKTTSATSLAQGTTNATSIGATADLSTSNYFDGSIAEVAIFDLSVYSGGSDALKADNFERYIPSLAAGWSPEFIPGLKHYWPLGGFRSSNTADHDDWGGISLTPQNSPTTADHPSDLIYPTSLPNASYAATATGWTSQNLASLLQFSGLSWLPGIHSLPVADDTTLDQAEKQHVLGLYSGILVSGAVGDDLIAQSRQAHRFVNSRIFGRVN